MIRKTYLTILAVSFSLSAFAGSFQLNLQGIRQMAMGGSGVAIPWDAASIFYNPGSLARLGGLQAYGSIYVVSPHVRYLQTPTGGYYYDTKTHTATPFALYVGGNIKKDSKLALGLGVYTPFGNSLHWDEHWTGRYMVQSIALSSIFIQPTISYAINEAISVGAGFVYAMGNVAIEKAIPLQDLESRDGHAELKGRASGFGFNAGVQIRASDRINIGLSYRSAVSMKVKDGDASFIVASAAASGFPATTFSTELPLPALLTGGVGIKLSKAITLQADLVYAFWGTYDSLRFDFSENTTALQDVEDPRSYKNTLAVRIGGHYVIKDKWEIMLGGAYDPTPSQDNLVSPDAVDANRISLSCGAGFRPVPKLSIMAGINYTTTGVRDTSYDPAGFKGAYKINSLSPAVGIAYQF